MFWNFSFTYYNGASYDGIRSQEIQRIHVYIFLLKSILHFHVKHSSRLMYVDYMYLHVLKLLFWEWPFLQFLNSIIYKSLLTLS